MGDCYQVGIWNLPGAENTPAVVEISRDLLRLLLAGQAMAGYISAYAHPAALCAPDPEDAAQHAEAFADALLARPEESDG